jgi:hypothetical protein
MAEQFLEHADVHPVLQHVGGEAMTPGVAAGLLVDPSLLRGPFHRLLQAGCTPMMAHLPGRTWVEGPLPGREYLLPAGLPQGLGGFPGQRLGDVHVSASRFKVLVMEGFRRLDRRLQLVPQVPGQEGGPVLAALAAPDADETLAEIDLVEAPAETRQQAQTTAIEPPRQEGMPARHGGEPPLNLRLSEPGGRPWLAFPADRGDLSGQRLVKDSPLESNQGVQGLPRGGGRHLALSGEMGEKPFHIRCLKPVRRGLAAEVRERAKYPLARGLLGTVGVVVIAEHLAHLVHALEAGIGAKCRVIFLLTFHILL